MRRWMTVLVVATTLLGCSADPYSLTSDPHSAQWNPALVGEPIQAVVAYVRMQPGDEIEFLGAEPIGVAQGASVRFLLSRPVIHDTGESVIGEDVEPLEHATATAAVASDSPDNTIGIVGELVADRPGRYEVTNVRLRYRLNGGPERVTEGIDTVWTVCAADDPEPAIDDCDGEEAPD